MNQTIHFVAVKISLLTTKWSRSLAVSLLLLFSILHSPCSVQAQIPSYVPTSGLVGYWPFNGNANDESGNGNNGTVNGATLTTDRFGAVNKAYSFDGVNDFINVINPSVLNFSPGVDFTVSFFYKPSTTTTNPGGFNGLVSRMRIDNAGPMNGWQIGRNNSIYKIEVQSSGCGLNLNSIVQNNWVNVLVVFNRTLGQIQYYIDGTLVNTTNCSSLSDSFISAHDLKFGVERSGVYYSSGVLDDIAIYNRALSQQEVSNLYSGSAPPSISTTASPTLINCGESATLTASSTSAAQPCAQADLPTTLQSGLVGYWPFCGNANDASGNGNNGTVNGATLTTDRFGNANSAYNFNGSSDFLLINQNFSTISGITISCWVNLSADLQNNKSYVNFSDNSQQGIGLVFDQSAQKNIGYSQNVYLPSTNLISLNVWRLLTITIDMQNNVSKYYENGILMSQTTSSNFITNLTELNIGRHHSDVWGYDWYMNGKLDDIFIHNRALTPTEIQQLYTLGNVNYSWSTGATTPSITVSPAQTTSYTCTATNSAGSTISSVIVNVADSLLWTGLVDTDWHKPCNWSPQFVPKCCNNVSIPLTSNQPIVSGVAAAEDLTIYTTNGAQITVNTGANLQIADCPSTITTATCPSLAILTTTAVSSITQTTAISGGTISYQGASAITARGICWSTSINPTIANSFTTNGTGVGTFTSSLTGLTAGTTYFVRAYATNAGGTSYGNEVSFATSAPLLLGQNYQGGTIVYLLQAGDPGFDAANQHGIIVNPSLLGTAEWGCYGTQLNVFNTAYGAGNNNTNSIVAGCMNASYAAKICYNLSVNGYSDWYLPSKDELNKVYLQRLSLAFLNNSVGYWSSSETAMNTAYGQLFGQSQASSSVSASKTTPYYVVAIRNF
jgi:hypothetical protein